MERHGDARAGGRGVESSAKVMLAPGNADTAAGSESVTGDDPANPSESTTEIFNPLQIMRLMIAGS
jgi:hypothetical protein